MSNNPNDPYTQPVPGFHPQTGAAQPESQVPFIPEHLMTAQTELVEAQTELAKIQTEDKFIQSVKKQSQMWDKMKSSGPSIMKLIEMFDIFKPFMMFFIPFKPIIAEISKILTVMFLPIVKALIPYFQDFADALAYLEPYAEAFGEFLAGLTFQNIGDAWENFWSNNILWQAISGGWEAFWSSSPVTQAISDAWFRFWNALNPFTPAEEQHPEAQPPPGGGMTPFGTRGGMTSLREERSSKMLEVKIEENTEWLKKIYNQQVRASRGLRRNI